MERTRISLTVIVSLDPIPGAFHTPKSAEEHLQALLLSYIGHYDPVVILDQI